MVLLLLVPPGVANLPGACTSDQAFEHVPGLGEACRTLDAWKVRLADGTVVETHGHDPAGGPGDHGLGTIHETPRAPVCVDDLSTRAHGLLIYAHASDLENQYDLKVDAIRHLFYQANGLVRRTAEDARRTAALKMACTAEGRLRVDNVTLPTSALDTSFGSVASDLRDMGYTSDDAKYWVWYDGRISCGCSGTGHIHRDDSPGPGNEANSGPDFGVTWGRFSARTMLHEASHNMGAVQPSAPHTSGAWHCNDGLDIMCYADGGPESNYRQTDCPGYQRYDCGNDDYFDADPTPAGYLANHWNLGSPANRFIAFDDLQDVPAPPTVRAAPGPSEDRVTLEWTPPADEGASRIQEYVIYRGDPHGTLATATTQERYEWTVRARVDGGTTTYTDALDGEGEYAFRVSAVNGDAESEPSAPALWVHGQPGL